MNKKWVLIFLSLLFANTSSLYAQLTIEECYQKARFNYPQLKKYQLLDQAQKYQLSNTNSKYLPQFSLSARGTYQSEVLQLPASIPGVSALAKDQYQAGIAVTQLLWDAGLIKANEQQIIKATALEKQKLEVTLYSLQERVNQLFLGTLLVQEQLKQRKILEFELQTNYERLKNLAQNGLANQSDLDRVQVEQLHNKQQQIELGLKLKSAKDMLSILIGENITEKEAFIKPDLTSLLITEDLPNKRPELNLLKKQQQYLSCQKQVIQAKNSLKSGLFFQGNYGRPGLNPLQSEFGPYYITGINFSWPLDGFYTEKKQLKLIDNNIESINVEKETFLFNARLKATEAQAAVKKYQELIRKDDTIIELRSRIKKAAEAKVVNGTLAVTDLLREINAESIACQTRSLHEIQLLIALYQLKYAYNLKGVEK